MSSNRFCINIHTQLAVLFDIHFYALIISILKTTKFGRWDSLTKLT